MASLDALMTLAKAGRYASPDNEADVLPVVIGDFTSGAGAGLIPTVPIDTENFIYLAAGHPMGSISAVYVDGVEVAQGYTAEPSVNVEGQGLVAAVTFEAEPDGDVTVRGKGLQVSGSTVENWADAVVEILKLLGGFTDDDFDQPALARSRAACTSQGLKMAYVVSEEATAKVWLTTLMGPVIGSFDVSDQGLIRLIVPPSRLRVEDGDVAGHVVAARDVASGDDGVTYMVEASNLVNAVSAKWDLDFVKDAFSKAADDWDTPASQVSKNRYGERRVVHEMKGLRGEVGAKAVVERIFEAHSEPIAVVSLALERLKGLGWSPGDIFGLTWPWGPDSIEQGMTNRLFKVEGKEVDLLRHQARFTASDTGAYLCLSTLFDAEADFDASVYLGAERDLTVHA